MATITLPDPTVGEEHTEPPVTAGAAMAHLDRELTVQHADDDFFRQFGSTPGDLCGQNFRHLVHPSVRRPIMRRFAGLLDGRRRRFQSDLIGVRPDRSVLTGALTGVVVRGDTPGAAAVLVLIRAQDAEPAEAEHTLVAPSKLLGRIEAQVLEGVAAGLSTIALATRVHLSRQGVEYHVSGLLRKMRVPNRAALVSRAYAMGVLTVGMWPPKVIDDYVK